MPKRSTKTQKKSLRFLRKSKNYKKILVEGMNVSISDNLIKLVVLTSEPNLSETESLKVIEDTVGIEYVAEGELVFEIGAAKRVLKSLEKAVKKLDEQKEKK